MNNKYYKILYANKELFIKKKSQKEKKPDSLSPGRQFY